MALVLRGQHLGNRDTRQYTWVMGLKDVPQPDIALRLVDGQSHVDGKYLVGAPELVVEVTDSSTSRDLGAKKLLYERAGVREYISVLTQTNTGPAFSPDCGSIPKHYGRPGAPCAPPSKRA